MALHSKFNIMNLSTFVTVIKRGTVCLFGAAAFLMVSGCAQPKQPDSNFNGVPVGVISYSWRNMNPYTAESVLQYCLASGISSIELMGNVAEAYAGLPPSPPRLPRGIEISEEERAAHRKATEEAKEKQRQWRLNASMDKYRELRKMYNDSGVNIHIVKFAPAS